MSPRPLAIYGISPPLAWGEKTEGGEAPEGGGGRLITYTKARVWLKEKGGRSEGVMGEKKEPGPK